MTYIFIRKKLNKHRKHGSTNSPPCWLDRVCAYPSPTRIREIIIGSISYPPTTSDSSPDPKLPFHLLTLSANSSSHCWQSILPLCHRISTRYNVQLSLHKLLIALYLCSRFRILVWCVLKLAENGGLLDWSFEIGYFFWVNWCGIFCFLSFVACCDFLLDILCLNFSDDRHW